MHMLTSVALTFCKLGQCPMTAHYHTLKKTKRLANRVSFNKEQCLRIKRTHRLRKIFS